MRRERETVQDAKADAVASPEGSGRPRRRVKRSADARRSGNAKGGAVSRRPPAPADRISDFRDAEYNPRKIEDVAAAGLQKSLLVFGDLSGLVWNRRTNHIVCGHQRRAELTKLIHDHHRKDRIEWEKGTFAAELGEKGRRFKSVERRGYVTAPGGARFTVRAVDWPEKFKKQANVAANATTIQGEFVEPQLLPLLEEIKAQPGDIFNDLMLAELLTKKTKSVEFKKKLKAQYELVIECRSEKHMEQLAMELKKRGLKCRPKMIPAD